MTMIELKPLGAAGRVFWTTAQLLGLVTTVVFIIGFFARPDTALNMLWNAAIRMIVFGGGALPYGSRVRGRFCVCTSHR